MDDFNHITHYSSFSLTEVFWGCQTHLGLNQSDFMNTDVFKMVQSKMESRRISVKKKKILHFAADISPKALRSWGEECHLEPEAAIAHAENKMMHWKWFLRCKGSRWQLNWRFVLMMWMCLRQKIGIGPRTANPLFPDKPPLFSHPACRMNCNTSPCVPLKEQSQLHARPHGGNVTDSVCQYHLCVCVCVDTPSSPFYLETQSTKGIVSAWQSGVTIPIIDNC